jgi:hypothetical protein
MFLEADVTANDCCPLRLERRNDVVDTSFRDFRDCWSPFLGSHGPAPVFAMSLGEISRERIRDRRPIRSDGSIHLIARAWAVRGRVPR